MDISELYEAIQENIAKRTATRLTKYKQQAQRIQASIQQASVALAQRHQRQLDALATGFAAKAERLAAERRELDAEAARRSGDAERIRKLAAKLACELRDAQRDMLARIDQAIAAVDSLGDAVPPDQLSDAESDLPFDLSRPKPPSPWRPAHRSTVQPRQAAPATPWPSTSLSRSATPFHAAYFQWTRQPSPSVAPHIF